MTTSPSYPQPSQKQAFLAGEGNQYFRRNHLEDDGEVAPVWVRELARIARPSSAVAEIGCGDGRNLAHLHAAANVEGWGVDPSTEAITAGKAKWPHLTLAVGTADDIPFGRSFELVVCGFFLYLVDRSLLSRVVAEVDRLVADGGTLAVCDFDPSEPRFRDYRHKEGLYSFKMAYDQLFLAFPHYTLRERIRFDRSGALRVDEQDGERCVLAILRKELSGGYVAEVANEALLGDRGL